MRIIKSYWNLFKLWVDSFFNEEEPSELDYVPPKAIRQFDQEQAG